MNAEVENNLPTLETERLLLRHFCQDDYEEYARWCADLEMMKYMGELRTLNRNEAWRSLASFVGHWRLRGYGMWAVEEKATGKLVGRVGLHYPEGWPQPEVGWTIAREHWGRGFAPEAGRAAIDYAFGQLGMTELISLIHPDNAASIRVAEKLGETHLRDDEVNGIAVRIYGLKRGDAE